MDNQQNRMNPVIVHLLLMALDAFVLAFSGFLALFVRFEFRVAGIEKVFLDNYVFFLPYAIVITWLVFAIFHMYSNLWRFAGVTELENMVAACFLSGAFQVAGLIITKHHMCRSYYLLSTMFFFMLTFVTRFSYRAITVFVRHYSGGQKNNVMIIGAGDATSMLIKEIVTSDKIDMNVRCVIDDDPHKKNSYIHGVKVVGDRNTIIYNAGKYEIHEIIIAIPSAKRSAIKNILDICRDTGCEIKMVPGIYQLVNGQVNISQLRDVQIEDLLGRDPIKIDIDSVLGYVKDKVVLVTGGGGSIGSELCRQLAGHHPKQLIIVDIYENNAYDIQQELKREYPELKLVVLIASVRNTARINRIFETYRPDIVYHAAAHKHVPLMEDSPNEAIKNNVFGTLKTVQAADRYGVKRFVMISTDKAVNPTNVMGATKRICEMIIQTYDKMSKTEFVAVRFGNVLGSNGSVIPLFKKQIMEGGPVTVTHPDIIRYFMTIPEAVSLVIQAGAYAKGGEIFVLDMGEPVKILDLAKNLIKLSGYSPDEDIKIKFTGLRPGEKLYEERLMKEEGLRKTDNELISIGMPIELDEQNFMRQLSELKRISLEEPDSSKIRNMVSEIVPTYHYDPALSAQEANRPVKGRKENKLAGEVIHIA
jgi:FlaA1/EpsC-like NDP-sugar epimerase